MNAIELAKKRSNLLMEMKGAFLHFIYETKDQLLQADIRKIATENALLRGTMRQEFLYEAKWYPQGIEIFPDSDRTLDPSLIKKMHDLVHDADYDAFEERHMVSNYLSAILQFAKNTADLKGIFPYPLHPMLFHYQGSAFETEAPKSGTEIMAFKEAHVEPDNCLKDMLVMRMLFKSD